jgi:hypothetical protein
MRHICKVYGHKVLTIIILLLGSSGSLVAQDKFTQINMGYDYQSFVDLGFNVEIERKRSDFDLLTINYGLAYVKYPPGGIRINGVLVSTITQEITNFSIKAKWYPIRLKNRPYSVLYIATGPMYAIHKFNKEIGYQGVGLSFSAGLNYLLFERLLIGVQGEYGLYYSASYEGIRTTDYSLSVRIGYRISIK